MKLVRATPTESVETNEGDYRHSPHNSDDAERDQLNGRMLQRKPLELEQVLLADAERWVTETAQRQLLELTDALPR